MSDLIRREELLTSQYVHTECYLQENKDRHFDVYKKGWNDALQAAHDNAPAVDAVEVVRCEYCMNRSPDYYCPEIERDVFKDFFCEKGIRRFNG